MLGLRKVESQWVIPNSLMIAALQARFTSKMKTKRENLSKIITLKKEGAKISIKKLKIIYDICRLD